MDGLLLIDKPSGPTSHDVIARLRRTSGERRMGHTGTLDPLASGLLPVVVGRATRLASLFSGGDKTYEATITLGVTTDTDDAEGVPTSTAAPVPEGEAVRRALDAFRGAFAQTPPRHSAKKIGGRKAYELARQQRPVELVPVTVTVHELELLGCDGNSVAVRVTVSAGFYVRALARDLGQALGCGAHLAALRRTRCAGFDVRDAVPLTDAERMGPDVAGRLLAPAAALPDLPAVQVTELGYRRAAHGNSLAPEHLCGRWVPPAGGRQRVRVLGPQGELLALAESRGGALHPVVVLG